MSDKGVLTSEQVKQLGLTEDQVQKIADFRKAMGVPFEDVPDHIQDDITLFRFLSGKKWDAKVSGEQYQSMLKWYKEEDVANIWEWENKNKEVIETILSMYPCVRYGFDREGRPLQITRLGMIPAPMFAEKVKVEDYVKFHILYFEKLARLCREQSTKLGKPIYQVSVIIDATGASFSSRHFKPFFSATAAVDKQNYPEFLNSVDVVNAHWMVPMLYNIVKPLLDPRTKEKIRMHTSEYDKALCGHIDAKVLPVAFGGLNRDPLPVPTVEGLEQSPTDTLAFKNVPARRSVEYTRACDDPKGGKFLWVIKLDSYDVNLTVQWTEKGGTEKKEVAVKEKISEDKGSFEVDGEGELTLTFDNTYSYLTSKDVRFAVYFTPGSEDAADTAEAKST
uniref:CRAL-TRIO domain-containing protein n=1 Tax=Lotharella globosa TaxID=91324 RepID=A0A7S3Z3R5_9EUKA|mmetsp:Transcript_12537/g.23840  ORF Transcript_12537/g.23840 Transcript_12537/m.23840 type:complete len:392 (+) Transcript_12537:16-1191(+)